MRRIVLMLLLAIAALSSIALAEEGEISFWDVIEFDPSLAIEAEPLYTEEPADTPDIAEEMPVLTPREDFIERIISYGHELYIKAAGKAQRAWKKGDIYLCKNFTTHIFNELRDDFCMAEFPDVKLRIPNNITEADAKPYYKGVGWEEISAEKGNPFYEAASFRYDTSLSKEENLKLAEDFMRQAQRGDFFQMNANYEYGTGPHSAIMMGYDAEKDEIHWMDSNMRGHSKTVNGERVRYGICQFDEVRSVEWWASTFCHKKRGATLYRLREDIAYRED
ncbi:MAG: hypothetical protein IJA77_03565 [Clostridia bacterium]|nr:hypothetical protein [Clostridia bacterium]